METKRLNSTLKTLSQIARAPLSSVQLMDKKKENLEPIAFYGLKMTGTYKKEKTIAEKAIKENRVQKVLNILRETQWNYPSFVKREGIVSLLSIPLVIGNKPEGVAEFYYKRLRKFNKKDIELISKISSQLALVIENIRLKKTARIFSGLAKIDSLTGLRTRKYFHESLTKELSRARRFKYPVSLIMIDIDHFKRFNDTYGHPAGDIVLKKIAGILRKNIRSYDMCVRYGGEELILILPYTKKQQAILLAERIRKEIGQYPFNGKQSEKVRITVSLGIAVYPANARTRERLIERADQALYLAKEEGRNRTCVSLIASRALIRFAFCTSSLGLFYRRILEGVREVMEDVGNVELIVKAPDRESIAKQVDLMEEYIKLKVDAIAICAKSKSIIDMLAKKANKSSIPVFLFNIMGIAAKGLTSKIVSSIGYDQREAGKMAGEYVVRLLRKKGKVAVIQGTPGQIDSIERKKGFRDIIRNYPEIKIVSSEPAYWDRTNAREAATKVLRKHPGVDAIFAVSDEMVLGVMDAVEKAGKKGEIFTIGLDGTQDAFQAIHKGELTATLNTNPVEMGKILMRTVIRSMIKGEKIQPAIHSPINIVDLENVERYLRK